MVLFFASVQERTGLRESGDGGERAIAHSIRFVSTAAVVGVPEAAATGQMENLVKAGVIDPAKVTKTAIEKAGSIALPVLTTEATRRSRATLLGRPFSLPAAVYKSTLKLSPPLVEPSSIVPR